MFSLEVEQKIKDKQISCLALKPIRMKELRFDDSYYAEVRKWLDYGMREIARLQANVIEMAQSTFYDTDNQEWITTTKIAYSKP